MNYENNPAQYLVEEKQDGRAGWVFYIEQSRLPLPWEILGAGGGVGISVPTPEEWDTYCEKHKAVWAKGRREEILQRVSQSIAEAAIW